MTTCALPEVIVVGPVRLPNRRPYRCPQCLGTGLFLGWFGFVESAATSSTPPCAICSGSGVVWSRP